MKTKVYEKATEYIESLAQSLGVAAEHVYGILVKQQVAEGISFLIVLPIALVIIAFALTKLIRAWKNFDGYDDFGYMMATVICGVFLLATIIAMLIEGPTAIMKIINPEYYAIKEIAEMVTGGDGQ